MAVDVGAAGRALLEAVTNHLEALNVVLPERQGLAPGNALAWDGEMLAVQWIALTRGNPDAPDAPQAMVTITPWQTIFFYEFHVTLLREVTAPTGRTHQGGLPTPEELTDDYGTGATDAVALMEALIAIHAGHEIVPPGIPFAYGPIAPIGPEGELCAVTSPVRFQAGAAIDGSY